LGSARVSRVGFGVVPKPTFYALSSRAAHLRVQEKFAVARTRSPARETRALPKPTRFARSVIPCHGTPGTQAYGRGSGVGRGRRVGGGLGVTLGVAVGVGLAEGLVVGVGVTLGVIVGVGVTGGVTVGVGVGVTGGVTVGVTEGVGVGLPLPVPLNATVTPAQGPTPACVQHDVKVKFTSFVVEL
jgi:hypothetical protein